MNVIDLSVTLTFDFEIQKLISRQYEMTPVRRVYISSFWRNGQNIYICISFELTVNLTFDLERPKVSHP